MFGQLLLKMRFSFFQTVVAGIMTSTDRRFSLVLCLLVCTVFVPTVLTSFINYAPGFEYLYNLNSVIELREVQTFLSKGQVNVIDYIYLPYKPRRQSVMKPLH
jgi:hypothetical protein